MSLKVPKNFFYQLLFALCVGVTYLNNYELTFAVWCLVIVITLKKRFSLGFLQLSFCYLGILAIGLSVTLFNDYSWYAVIRDITYMAKPVMGMLIGYQLCRNTDIQPFKTIIYTSLLVALIHLGIIFYSAIAYRIIHIHKLREYGGYFGDFEFFGLIFLLFYKQFDIRFTAKRRLLLLLVIGFSASLYLSRMNFLQFFIVVFALKGYFKATPRALKILGTLVVVTLVGYALIYNMNLTRNGKGIEAFLFKVKNAPIEAFKTRVNVNDYEDFNDNYRSYENIITVKQVVYEGNQAILFGKGLGSDIDLRRKMWTNDGEFIRYIPVLHNAFMTVFLKSGLLGIALFILYIFWLGRSLPSHDPMVRRLNALFLGIAIFMVLANWVLMGLYLKIDNKSILIGFLFCYREMLAKFQRNQTLPIE